MSWCPDFEFRVTQGCRWPRSPPACRSTWSTTPVTPRSTPAPPPSWRSGRERPLIPYESCAILYAVRFLRAHRRIAGLLSAGPGQLARPDHRQAAALRLTCELPVCLNEKGVRSPTRHRREPARGRPPPAASATQQCAQPCARLIALQALLLLREPSWTAHTARGSVGEWLLCRWARELACLT